MSYSYDEMRTLYVITYHNPNIELKFMTDIIAWSNDKNLAKFYMKFHKCKFMKLNKIHGYPKELINIMNENINCEIYIAPLRTRNLNNNEIIFVNVPVTELEMTDIRSLSGIMNDTDINYRIIYEYYDYFKNKYRKALDTILLGTITEEILFTSKKTFSSGNDDEFHNMYSINIGIDEIAYLYYREPELFEK